MRSSNIDNFRTSTHLDWHSVDALVARTLQVAEAAARRGIALVFAAALRNSQTRSAEHTDRSSDTGTEAGLEEEVVGKDNSEDELDEDSLRSD